MSPETCSPRHPPRPDAGPELGVLQIEADKVWNLDGKRGEGIVVASGDTGVEWTHPALKGKYRGWNGATASHDFNWFDAIEDTAEPIRRQQPRLAHHRHDGGRRRRWAIRSASRRGAMDRLPEHELRRRAAFNVHRVQSVLPRAVPHGGDPETDGDPSKAPDIVNNSWECPPTEGCDLVVLKASFSALRAAGILAVAGAGNNGPNCSTVSTPPAIYDEAFVVGATDMTEVLASFSSRGPVTIDGSGRPRPDVVAPGVGVRS